MSPMLRLLLALVVVASLYFFLVDKVLSREALAVSPPAKAPAVTKAAPPAKGEPRAPLGILTSPAELEKAKEREPERDRESLDYSPPSESYDSSSSSDD